MKTGTKLLLSLVVPIVVLMVLYGLLDQRRSREQLTAEHEREGRAIALVIRMAVEDALTHRHLADLRELADRVGGYAGILGVRIFDQDGSLIYESDTLAEYPFGFPELLSRVLESHQQVEAHRRLAGEPVVAFFEPLLSASGALLGAIQVLQLQSFIEEEARASRNANALLTAAMIVATSAIVFVVTRINVVRPVDGLLQSFREVGSGDLRARVPHRYSGELGLLAREFNRMCERLQEARENLLRAQEERRVVEQRLQRSEHLASLGRMAAGLAHEIGTPLNVIGGRTDAALRDLREDATATRNLKIVAEQIDRIVRIVRAMLDFARASEPRFATAQLAPIIRKVLDFMEQRLAEHSIECVVELPEDLPAVRADADQIYQVFLNLVVNAVDAMPRGGTLTVNATRDDAPDPESPGALRSYLRVSLRDTGIGIPEQDAGRVFEPFFTTKGVGGGTGMGLAVSWGVIRMHGGWIDLQSKDGEGTSVTVHLPLDPERRSASNPRLERSTS